MTMNTLQKWWSKNIHPKKLFPIALIIFGIIGLSASAAISIEKEHTLKNPGFESICNINPIYSCSNVFLSPQSKILGVSNELAGIAVFAVLITVGVMLLAGAQLKKWFWYAFMLGMLGFMLMVIWFFSQSVYVIGALCIFCSIVWFSAWAITTIGFAWLYDNKLLDFHRCKKVLKFVRNNIALIWFFFILVLATLMLNHFWYYYGQYFN